MPDPKQGSASAFGRKRGYGVSVGDFYIDSEIGKGSFAQVYMGVHKESKEIVAVKSVELSKLNKKLKDNLYGEIQILKTLRHPHIVALHDCVENPTHINLIMEYCELGDLSLFIKKREKLSTHPATHEMARKYPANPNAGLHEVVTRHFLKQLASALQFLRSKNYMHRDVKPQNLLLLPSPQYRNSNSVPIMTASVDSMIPIVGLLSLPMLKLADFGFARVLPSTSLADTLCGSPLYMAPEILRYERYDAKADLWSVGTVLYEMCSGRPPFRARNHVELLRKIEANQDMIKFPREATISPEMKSLIRALLKRQPTERISFENFFNHKVVVEPISGLVEDDVSKPAEKPADRSIERSLSRRSLAQLHQESMSSRRRSRQGDELPEVTSSPIPRPPRSPKMPNSSEARRLSRPSLDGLTRHTYAPGPDAAEGLGIRPKPHSTSTAPARPHGLSDVSSMIPAALQEAISSGTRPSQALARRVVEEDKAAQDVADMREYVMIEKRQVEINAFADELDVNRHQPHGQSPPSSGPIAIRRNTHQSTTAGAGGMSTSPRSQALIGRDHASGSPGSASSIAKAIQDASLRLFGYYKYNARPNKGQSPPTYNPFPAYPTPTQPVALIGDGRSTASLDDESRCVQAVEDLATRSDVVYCFAEIKFKQVFPTAPSVDLALGGALVEDITSEEDDLTAEAIVGLSEEAFVLYFKVLTLLAKAMDIANAWWMTKRGLETPQDVVHRVNAVVQWVRNRFNEVLEKTELVQLKLMEGQKRLPDTHPSHPNNHGNESTSSTVSGLVVMATGITAEKLMYDRALDMSRAAAIREISHNDLPGCEISYLTAIRMLEVVLDSDDDSVRKKVSGVLKDSMEDSLNEPTGNLDNDDKQAVRKLIQMIRARLLTVHRKMQDIAEAEKSQQALQITCRRRSGDETPRSVPSHASPP